MTFAAFAEAVDALVKPYGVTPHAGAESPA